MRLFKKNLLAVLGTLFLAFSLATPLTLAAPAPSIKDCDDAAKAQKCRDDYKECTNNNCRQDVLDKYARDGNDANGNNNSDASSDPTAGCDNDSCDIIKKYVNPTIKALSFLVGLIAATSLIVGGIQYTASSGDPQKVTAAKKRIEKTIIALVMFSFLYAFLQFLIPGGAF